MTSAQLRILQPAPLILALLLLPVAAHCYYSAETGRWLSRDPIEEAGGKNIYAFTGNAPVQKVDPQGLSLFRRCKKCCCCAESVTIPLESISLVDNVFTYGHRFTAVIQLSYVLHHKDIDCKLEWWEKTNRGYTEMMRRQEWKWYDITQDPETANEFGPWKKHLKPCPGSPPAILEGDQREARRDFPARTLLFYIRVWSAPGCPCSKPYARVTAKQVIDPAQTPPDDRIFVTPNPD